MRSLLVVRAESAAALDAAFEAGADALVLDLGIRAEDKAAHRDARRLARDFLRAAQLETRRPLLYVRLEGLDEDGFDDDLSAIMIGEPDGIVLGACRSGIDVQHLGAKLAVHEAEYGLTDGETGVIAEAAATARALFKLGSYCDASARLIGLTWHAERLSADLGGDHAAMAAHDFPPFHTVRHLTLFAARAAEVTAIDSASLSANPNALVAECETARRHGFNAKIAASADQISVINSIFDREDAKPFS